jgi:hypothetical protein
MSNGATTNKLAMRVTIVIRANPGTKRLTLLAQKRDSTIEFLLLDSSRRFRVIKNPEITKKMSTPMNPPENPGRPA